MRKKNIYLRRELPLHLMLLPGVVLLLAFSYLPMYGVVVAFQKFIPARGLFGHQSWIGLDNYRFILSLPNIWNVMRNTVVIAVLKIIGGLIVPIIFSLLINEVRNSTFKRSIQTLTYFPYFLSWVIFGGVLIDILSPSSGIVNKIIQVFGFDPVYFLGNDKWFPVTAVITDIWKNFGFGTVIYLAAITNIDITFYEVASIDGANRWQQTWHITLPGMKMIIVLMMVLSLGDILNAGFDQIFNLYSPQVYDTGDIIDTFVYRLGLLDSKYGPATAVGLFKSAISTILISISYYTAYKFFDYRLF